MQIIELKKNRDILLREAKQNKSKEYREGYINGVFDAYNVAAKMIANAEALTKAAGQSLSKGEKG